MRSTVIVPLKRTLQESVAKIEKCYLCGDGHTTVGTLSPYTVVFCNQCERPCHIKCYNKGIKPEKLSVKLELNANIVDMKNITDSSYQTFQRPITDSSYQTFQRPTEVLLEYAHFHFMYCGKCQLLHALLYQRAFHEKRGLCDLCWRMFSGRDTRSDVTRFIPQVIDNFRAEFAETAAQDNHIIRNMVNAKDVSGEKDFRGMYCAVLTARTFVVSAAILKVHTEEAAELVLAATHNRCCKKGFFRLLLEQIEEQLKAWHIWLLIAPVDPEMESIWSKKLGFTILTEHQKRPMLEACPIAMFQNQRLAQKSLI